MYYSVIVHGHKANLSVAIYLHRILKKKLSGISFFLFPSENEQADFFGHSCSPVVDKIELHKFLEVPYQHCSISGFKKPLAWRELYRVCIQDLLYVFFRAVVGFLPL